MQWNNILNNKVYRGAALGALALILVIYFASRPDKINENGAPLEEVATTTPVETATTTTTKAPAASQPSVKKPSLPAGQSASNAYLQALNIYQKTGYYMQFFPCEASPGSLILKKGSKIMLDNRDSKAHTIGIRSVRYNIGAYNFAIATVDSLGTNYVTCDGGGSGQITVVP